MLSQPSPDRYAANYPLVGVTMYPNGDVYSAVVYLSIDEKQSAWTFEQIRDALLLGLEQHMPNLNLSLFSVTQFTEATEAITPPDPDTPVTPPTGG